MVIELTFIFTGRWVTAAPDDTDRGNVVLTAIEHDFFDETPQQRFALSIHGGRVSPDLWETAGEADNLAMQGIADPHVSDGLGRGLLDERFFGRPDFVQSHFPAALEFRGDKSIVGIDLVELPFGQSGGVPLPLKLTFRTGAQGGIHLHLGAAGPRQRIKLGRCQRRQERVCHGRVDTRGADMLAVR